MRVSFRWILGGLILFLVMAVATLPARQVLYRLALPETIHLGEVTGPWWQGRVAPVRFRGVNLEAVSWRWSVGALLRGRLGAAVRFNLPGGGAGRGSLARGPGGQTYLDAVQARLPAGLLARAVPELDLEAAGQLELHIDRARLTAAGRPVEAQGRLIWHDAALASPLALSLGTLVADIQTPEPEQLVLRFDDRGGPLALDGELSYDPASGSYAVDLAMRSRSAPELREALALLGPPDARGRYRLSRRGRLPLP